MRLSTIQAPAVSMLFTTSTGSRSTEGMASGSWLIATLPELYSIRSRGSAEASCARRGSVRGLFCQYHERLYGEIPFQRVIICRNHRRYFGDAIHDDFSWR